MCVRTPSFPARPGRTQKSVGWFRFLRARAIEAVANAGERWVASFARTKRFQTQESVGERSSRASLKVLSRKTARTGLMLTHALYVFIARLRWLSFYAPHADMRAREEIPKRRPKSLKSSRAGQRHTLRRERRKEVRRGADRRRSTRKAR